MKNTPANTREVAIEGWVDGMTLRRVPELDSPTTKCFIDEDRMVGIDSTDSHVAYIINRHTRQLDYRCKCIQNGQRMSGMTVEEMALALK